MLDGSEGWTYVAITQGFTIPPTDTTFALRNQNVYDGYCNYFTVNKNSSTWTNVYYCGWNTSNTFWLKDGGNIATSLTDFKTWLSTHNTIVNYPLATPKNTEITDTTLITQLNNLEKALSYQGQTNISQTNNDLPFNLDTTAIRDLSGIFELI